MNAFSFERYCRFITPKQRLEFKKIIEKIENENRDQQPEQQKQKESDSKELAKTLVNNLMA
ncbi:hypothetical protein ABDK00_013210 [Niabella insulamsoli]|uniref:hypothetical protein n=1 Tax=Niabella insulamsoli TaxID=3144874 RepID=UPI0031FC185A